MSTVNIIYILYHKCPEMKNCPLLLSGMNYYTALFLKNNFEYLNGLEKSYSKVAN